MRRNSFGVLVRQSAFALLPALALTILFFGGGAHAATVAAMRSTEPVSSNCIQATPLTQTVKVGEPANVTVDVFCYPAQSGFSPFLYLTVIATWGDSSITQYQYPVCVEVCHAPPFVIPTTHTYTSAGDYYPTFCLGPTTSTGAAPQCANVEITVIS